MSRPSQRAHKPKKIKDKDSQETNTNRKTPTVTQVPLTKYITHKDFPLTQIGQKDSKKRTKSSGEIPPDKRYHKSEETPESMNVNPENNDQTNTQVNTQNHGKPPNMSVNTKTFVNTVNLQDQLNAMEQ